MLYFIYIDLISSFPELRLFNLVLTLIHLDAYDPRFYSRHHLTIYILASDLVSVLQSF